MRAIAKRRASSGKEAARDGWKASSVFVGICKLGATTLAIGNPFGLDHTLTVGVVSGLGREVASPTGRPITNVIQTARALPASFTP